MPGAQTDSIATAEDEEQTQSVLANIKATYVEPALEGVFHFIGVYFVSFCDSVLRASWGWHLKKKKEQLLITVRGKYLTSTADLILIEVVIKR